MMQNIRIKDWNKFQHFKDRTPPWIKLYREILDDPDWHELEAESAKVLVSLWLIASEDDTHAGKLPDMRRLAFRLRISEIKLKQVLTKLSHWLVHDDDGMISTCHRSDAPETETETETETEISFDDNSETQTAQKTTRGGVSGLPTGFDSVWAAYPRKIGKGAAAKAFAKIRPDKALIDRMLAAILVQKQSQQWTRDGGQFIPHLSTWLNAGRWDDEPDGKPAQLFGNGVVL